MNSSMYTISGSYMMGSKRNDIIWGTHNNYFFDGLKFRQVKQTGYLPYLKSWGPTANQEIHWVILYLTLIPLNFYPSKL